MKVSAICLRRGAKSMRNSSAYRVLLLESQNLCKSTSDFTLWREEFEHPHAKWYGPNTYSFVQFTAIPNLPILISWPKKHLHLGSHITIKVTKSTSWLSFIHLNDTYTENHCNPPIATAEAGKEKALCLSLFKQAKSTSSGRSID